jgi:histone deacetylase 6
VTRETALIAAGTAVDTVAAVAGAGALAGVAIVRPPGHHACADEASGFCYFNNVAVAVKAAQAEFGLRRIMGACQYDSHPPVLPRALK